MARKSGEVSDAEMEILQTLWNGGPATVREVSDRLGPEKNRWAYTTIQTMLGRLEAKGFVHCDKTGLAHVFRPAITRQRFLSNELAELANKVCDGMTMPLVRALVDRPRFTEDELAEFRRMLDEAASARDNKKRRSNP